MKRGVSFIPGVSSASMVPSEVCGVRVEYRADSKHPLADARGYGKKAFIVVGPAWYRLSPAAQEATLYHEAGHIIGRHREFRVLMSLLLFVPALALLPWMFLACIAATLAVYYGIERLAQNQELDADLFAAKKGSAEPMLQLVRSFGPPPTVPFFYPDYERRCGALVRFLEEQKHE